MLKRNKELRDRQFPESPRHFRPDTAWELIRLA
jgi:hypothetical protein